MLSILLRVLLKRADCSSMRCTNSTEAADAQLIEILPYRDAFTHSSVVTYCARFTDSDVLVSFA